MIYRASVTLCSLRDPLGFKTTPHHAPRPHGGGGGGTASHEPRGRGSPPLHLPHVVAVGGGILSRDDGGGHTPGDVRGRAPVSVLSVVGSGDPAGFAGLQIGCHGEGEDHRVGW